MRVLPCLPAALCLCVLGGIAMAAPGGGGESVFPPSLESYGDAHFTGLWSVLQNRVAKQPLNLWASLLFFAAILHTFFASRFLAWAHTLQERATLGHASARARLLHFLGEVEVVFGIWCVPLFALLAAKIGWEPAVDYLGHRVSYVEPVFVVVIMAIASTRPVMQLAERGLRFVAQLGGGGTAAWWLTILTLGPILGSLITEPAAMTIAALLLAKQFYVRQPSPRLAYATLGLLFVNISVGGSLTHFAAPPVLMVAAAWNWSTAFMFIHFGLAAMTGICLSNGLYYFALRKEFAQMAAAPAADTAAAEAPVPFWVTGTHLGFISWTVLNAHYPPLLIGGFLFFLAFYEITREYQSEFHLRSPLLVGFFLAGLVVHGGLQRWWIEPLLSRLSDVPLLLGATVLTAFNDNAAITYLATLVPGLTEPLKHAVVAGALAGGGLTVIANAPNPAGQSILSRHFPDGVEPIGLLKGALPATIIMVVCFLCAR